MNINKFFRIIFLHFFLILSSLYLSWTFGKFLFLLLSLFISNFFSFIFLPRFFVKYVLFSLVISFGFSSVLIPIWLFFLFIITKLNLVILFTLQSKLWGLFFCSFISLVLSSVTKLLKMKSSLFLALFKCSSQLKSKLFMLFSLLK